METTYYIYHIPTYVHKNGMIGKIGVTKNLKGRIVENTRSSQQTFDFWEVLETHSCKFKVSDREIELQKQYGYKVDTTPYWKTILSATFEGRSKVGKKNLESGHLKNIGKKPKYSLRKLTFEDAQKIRELYANKKDNKTNQYKLAEIYGIDQAIICNIINNKGYTQP